jgi:hypothetical protein
MSRAFCFDGSSSIESNLAKSARGHVFAFSRQECPSDASIQSPSRKEGQGAPGVRRTRSLACK